MAGRSTNPELLRGRLRVLLGLVDEHDGGSDGGTGVAELLGPTEAPAASRSALAPEPALVQVLTADGDSIPAHLLRPAPDVATGAGVVLVAGHGRGIDDLVAQDPVDDYHDGLAHKLARAGFTVLCPEMVSFGRRRFAQADGAEPYEPTDNTCGIDAARHLLHGRPVMGHRAADAQAAVQALRRLPGVDPDRVGVAGGSGGGAVALLLAAVDPSIAAALVATYFCTFEASLCSIRHCPCNIIPGLLPELEMADIAALIAPRPLILEAGEQDRIFPIAATRAAYARLEGVWEEHGATPPELVVTDGGHAFRAERSLDALVERLA
ncbi:MAG: dienelactone hydrolase family protein [Brachybacterium tyrofermentans]|uniref:dienelactone hydrolase family protein n=1 Tax=Brachybacterium tyrofermentans TaxID=47848 RepID=UPI001866AFA1|nr:dienelactone hydrolase family protein [Brachybacterium tyrofermentans]